MILKYTYSLIAPFYDAFLGTDRFNRIRQHSISAIKQLEQKKVLISGIGTGLDLPFLPEGGDYYGLDITPAMLRQATERASQLGMSMTLQQGDVMQLPFGDEQFDVVLMHLILAVVPHPEKALAEAKRVLKTGGHIVIVDKFLRRKQHAWLRRSLSPLSGLIATRLNVVFEDLHQPHDDLRVLDDQPVLARGWFRRIVLIKDKRD